MKGKYVWQFGRGESSRLKLKKKKKKSESYMTEITPKNEMKNN